VVANQLRHHVLEWDGGGRTTVLCLHGFLDLAWGFAPIAPALAAAGLHVVAPDLRGHGDSERVGAGGYYHFLDYVFDVADLADALARDRLVVAGHSMGGSIAAYYAGAFPARVARLVVMEGVGVPVEPYARFPERTAEWIDSVRRARTRAPRVYPSIAAAAARLCETDPRCDEPTALFLAEHGTRAVDGGRVFKHDPVHVTRGPYGFRLELARAFWERITAPTLLVDAAHSIFLMLPDLEERYAFFRAPGTRRARIEDAAHMMIRHQPGAVAREVLAFLREGGLA